MFGTQHLALFVLSRILLNLLAFLFLGGVFIFNGTLWCLVLVSSHPQVSSLRSSCAHIGAASAGWKGSRSRWPIYSQS
mgnify:CR=1 FL=1